MHSETLFIFMFTETLFEIMFAETLFNFMLTGLMSFGNPPSKVSHPSFLIFKDMKSTLRRHQSTRFPKCQEILQF